MKDYISVLKLLKRFGIYVYTGNREDDISLMLSEVKDLYDNGLIIKEDYLSATLILRSELSKIGL